MASCANNCDLILFFLVPLTFRASWLCVFALEYTGTGRQAGRLLHWLPYVENVKVWGRRLMSVIQLSVKTEYLVSWHESSVQSLLDNRMARCLNNSVTGNTWFCVFSSSFSFDLSCKLAMCVLICFNPQTLCGFKRSYFTIKAHQGYCCSRSFRVAEVII